MDETNAAALKRLGEHVRQWRTEVRGTTLAELAVAVGLDVATLRALEAGTFLDARQLDGHRLESALGWAAGSFERILTDGIDPIPSALPSSQFWRQALTQGVRQADQVGYSLLRVGQLPRERELATSDAVATSCLEAWLVHVRLLAEFLLVKPANPGKDFSAKDFGWDGQTTYETAGIERMWLVASRFVVHFSRDRTPVDVFDVAPLDVSYHGLVTVARSVLALAQDFVTFLETAAHEEAARFRADLDDAWTALDRKPA
jgi:hypothetical protein